MNSELKADVRGFLRVCQRRPAKVARYFHERHASYAAATNHLTLKSAGCS